MLLLGEQDFAVTGHDSFDANRLVMVTPRQATSLLNSPPLELGPQCRAIAATDQWCKQRIQSLRRYGRPVVCTEYMARPRGSTFASILPLLKSEKVGAYNWGFVNGKSQTIYPWDSWDKTYTAEPLVWFCFMTSSAKTGVRMIRRK
jgi:hypothetical protein